MLDLRIVIDNSAKEPSDQHKTHARMHFPYIHTHTTNETQYRIAVIQLNIFMWCTDKKFHCAVALSQYKFHLITDAVSVSRENEKTTKKSSGGILPCPFVHFITYYRTNTAFTSYNRHMAYSAMHPLL